MPQHRRRARRSGVHFARPGLLFRGKPADLRKELPLTTKWVTQQDRAEQRASRAKHFKLRCLGTPCEVGGELDKQY